MKNFEYEPIPKIIHQIWSGIDEPLPRHFEILGKTWQYDYPDWKYELWDNAKMNDFILNYYPQYWNIYQSFPHNVQRWDSIRYLILEQYGGMYVDFDYESLRPLEDLLLNKSCCFSQEPLPHQTMTEEYFNFNNALMLSVPKHPFISKIVKAIFDTPQPQHSDIKYREVFGTTGPWLINRLYNMLNDEEKNKIYIIPAKYVSPFDMHQSQHVRSGIPDIGLQHCLQEAYAIHYFYGGWN